MTNQARDHEKRSGGALKILLDLQGMQSKSRERGIGRLTRSLAHAMIDDPGPHDIHVLLNEGLDEALEVVHDEFAARLPADHIHSFGPFGDCRERQPELQWRARSAALLREGKIAKLRPDVVHVSSLFEGFQDNSVTSVGRLLTGHANSVTLYDLIPLADPESYLADPSYRSFYLRHVQDLKRANLLLSISQFSKQDAVSRLQIPSDKISVIYAGVDEKFRPTIVSDATRSRLRRLLATNDRFLLYVGAADARKNVQLIIEAYMLLEPDFRVEISIVFVGRLSEHEVVFIQEAGRRFDIPHHKIILLGMVDDADLIALYTMCEALIFPSTNEGFGLPPLEAMACGVPALVANAASLPEVVGRTDCLFDPNDARALARLIVRLADKGWRRELCTWGPKRAREFTWAAAGRKSIEAFEQALTPPPRTFKPGLQVKRDFDRRLRMAFISPLPPDKTGIADYSAELLRELLIDYEIDCIHPLAFTSDPWIEANCGLHDYEWFDANVDRYDRIVYSIGNSTFHTLMFGRLAMHPGVVILHDAFLSDLAVHNLQGAEQPSAAFLNEIYESHGLTGLRHLMEHGREGVVAELAMSGSVFRNANGVIMHSQYACSIAQRLFGDDVENVIAVVPHMRAAAATGRRADARTELSLEQNTFLICCFGTVHPRKMNRVVAEGFLASGLAYDNSCCLAFVGEADPVYGADLKAFVAERAPDANIRFVGRADADLYDLYLRAADVAVQLRTESRGETSGATLDAMAHGLAVIVSDIGAASELPDDVVLKVRRDVTAEEMATNLYRMRHDNTLRQQLGDRALAEINSTYHPSHVGARFRDLIERFTKTSRQVEERALITAISDIESDRPIKREDLDWIAAQTNVLLPNYSHRQVLVDVSAIAQTDLRTGIERVVRAILDCMVAAPPVGYRIEPTIIVDGVPTYARNFSKMRLGLPADQLKTTPVSFSPGDHYLALDWTPNRLPEAEPWLNRFRRQGGIVTVVVYDLLPLEQPDFFPDWLHDVCVDWVNLFTRAADSIACISRAVADSVAHFATPATRRRSKNLTLGVFHLGSDIVSSSPSSGLPEDAAAILATMRQRPTFLVLGTVEPRKGHAQLLASFELLWRDNVDIGLVIVGKEGWMVEVIAAAIRKSPMFGTKLTWLSNASDEFLEEIFGASTALIAPSTGEGFGLPLVEAAYHGLHLIIRDLAVFREIAGDGAFYFSGSEPRDLSQALLRWLQLHAEGQAPSSAGIETLTWEESTAQLFAVMFGQKMYREVAADDAVGIPKGVGC